jgi:diaminobutyrate-2-oxoglutarate transaminase
LARKVTKRKNVISFTNAFHGMTGVSLGLTGNSYHRQNVQDNNVTRMPYDGYMENLDTIAYLRKFLQDKSSGVDDPAAIIVETIQGEGGVNVASAHWIRELSQLAKLHGALLIIDDVQAGCGRTGDFFSFEFSDISPDMVCLSKSISGYGLPFSLLLIAPSHDKWDPAEDNGTFRGNNLAFISGAAAIKYFWSDSSFSSSIRLKEKIIIRAAEQMRDMFPQVIKSVRGRGLFYGIEFWNPETAKEVSAKCFEKKLIVETCGSDDQVIKLFPALNIPDNLLNRGMSILNDAVQTQHNFTSN